MDSYDMHNENPNHPLHVDQLKGLQKNESDVAYGIVKKDWKIKSACLCIGQQCTLINLHKSSITIVPKHELENLY